MVCGNGNNNNNNETRQSISTTMTMTMTVTAEAANNRVCKRTLFLSIHSMRDQEHSDEMCYLGWNRYTFNGRTMFHAFTMFSLIRSISLSSLVECSQYGYACVGFYSFASFVTLLF